MRKNSLGDRMKEYERTSDTKLVRRLPMIVRRRIVLATA